MKYTLLIVLSLFSDWLFGQDGIPDAGFGTNGMSLSGFVSDAGSPLPIAVQPDGKILQAASVTTGALHQVVVFRYNTNGGPDASFGNAGKVVASFTSNNWPRDIAIQNDGKIVVAGVVDSAGTNYFMIMRLGSNGGIDAGFGTNGRRIIPLHRHGVREMAIVLQFHGQLVVGGT